MRDLAKSTRFYTWLLGAEPKEWTHRYATFVRPELHTNFVLVVSDGKELHHDTLSTSASGSPTSARSSVPTSWQRRRASSCRSRPARRGEEHRSTSDGARPRRQSRRGARAPHGRGARDQGSESRADSTRVARGVAALGVRMPPIVGQSSVSSVNGPQRRHLAATPIAASAKLRPHHPGRVAELADAADLGSAAARRRGSTPLPCTSEEIGRFGPASCTQRVGMISRVRAREDDTP